LTQEVGDFEALFSQEDYEHIVEKIQHHIVEGDIFQAVVSNRFKAPFSGSLLQTYRLLRTINPSPYMVYMHFDDLEIACASPETLVSVRNGVASSFPLAGTVPRGATDAEDRALVEGLLQNEKELAEHDMLVDLARNDIGKVAEFGTLEVSEYRAIKHKAVFTRQPHFIQGNGKSQTGRNLFRCLKIGTTSGYFIRCS